MEAVDWKLILTLLTVVFAAGGAYTGLKLNMLAFRRDFDSHRAESIEWRRELKMTLFGADGRNGLVGDTIKHGEHIQVCKQHMEARGERHG